MINRISDIPENIYANLDYRHFLIQYEGNISEEFKDIDGIYVTIINDKYATLSVKIDLNYLDDEITYIRNIIERNNRRFDAITYIKILEIYTLLQTTPKEATNLKYIQNEDSINLKGNGVVVGIIDTGIDYLNDEFIDDNGNTRINFIWDQTIMDGKKTNLETPYGSIFTKEKINMALQEHRKGGNPYDIVPSKDEIGHGTNMASLVGAKGKNDLLTGVAPNCEFAIVKLLEAISIKERFDIKIPTYNITSLFSALELLKNYALKESKPLVILLPLGTSLGNHKGNSIMDKYIKSISINTGIVIVTGSGNEGNEGGHTSGLIQNVGDSKTIELIISNEDKNLIVDFWIDLPNVVSINVISPSGEESGIMQSSIGSVDSFKFILEETTVVSKEFIPEVFTGEQLIRIAMHNIRSGTWKFRLTLDKGSNATFNSWTFQSGIKSKNTRFFSSIPYGTITIPGDSAEIITAAAYNQENDNILNYSGMAFSELYLDRIDIAAGGKDALAVGPNNRIDQLNGTSVSAAILAGACTLLFQWGIVRGNNPLLSSQNVKTYLTRGTRKRTGDIYPNPQWGYGMLDIYGIFKNLT
ncbi:S8 family peptidase [Clostridium paraputrificum]|uniref:S8 family peptidase n=1 Tax=Clostridium TaxID=1485 RepID=UPI003D331460